MSGCGVVAVADQKAVLALDRFGRADEIVARQRGRDHAVHRGGADLVALVPGAVDQELQRARGLAAGDAERRDDLVLRQPEQFSRRRGRAIGSRRRGRMKAARVMRGRIERVAEPAAHFIAGHDRGQHVAAGGADHFADRERGRHHRRARMQRGVRMGVVEIERMAERAVEQRCHRRASRSCIAEHGGFALAVERQRFQHLEQRRRGFRIAPRPDRAAEEIQRQHLGALQHLRRDVLEFQVGDIGCERCGFVGHGVASRLLFIAGRAKRSIWAHRRCADCFVALAPLAMTRNCSDALMAILVRPAFPAVNISYGGSDPCFPCARSADRCGPGRRTARSRTRRSARPNGRMRHGPARCRR